MDNSIRYVGLEVHRDSISVAVLDSQGKVAKQTVIETKAAAVLEMTQELRVRCLWSWKRGPGRAGYSVKYVGAAGRVEHPVTFVGKIFL